MFPTCRQHWTSLEFELGSPTNQGYKYLGIRTEICPKMCTRQLQSSGALLRLSLLQKIKNWIFFFPQIHLITERHAIGRHNRDQLLKRPFARTITCIITHTNQEQLASLVNASSAAHFKKLWSEHNLELLNLIYWVSLFTGLDYWTHLWPHF